MHFVWYNKQSSIIHIRKGRGDFYETREYFELDGVPRLREACPLALQHVVAMIVGCVTPAIIVAGAAAGGLNSPGPCKF